MVWKPKIFKKVIKLLLQRKAIPLTYFLYQAICHGRAIQTPPQPQATQAHYKETALPKDYLFSSSEAQLYTYLLYYSNSMQKYGEKKPCYWQHDQFTTQWFIDTTCKVLQPPRNWESLQVTLLEYLINSWLAQHGSEPVQEPEPVLSYMARHLGVWVLPSSSIAFN